MGGVDKEEDGAEGQDTWLRTEHTWTERGGRREGSVYREVGSPDKGLREGEAKAESEKKQGPRRWGHEAGEGKEGSEPEGQSYRKAEGSS